MIFQSCFKRIVDLALVPVSADLLWGARRNRGSIDKAVKELFAIIARFKKLDEFHRPGI